MASCTISLTAAGEAFLTKFVKTGTRKASELTRARILLQSHASDGPGVIAGALQVAPKTVWKVRKRYLELGLPGALADKPRPGQPRKVTSEVEAKVTLLACEEPPVGRAKWSVSLIQRELAARHGIAISFGSVQHVLAAHQLKPWKKRCGAARASTPNL